jgi:hypothetical protein
MGAAVSEMRRTVTTSLLLRIASIISLLFAAGHTAGASWTRRDSAVSRSAVQDAFEGHAPGRRGYGRTLR